MLPGLPVVLLRVDERSVEVPQDRARRHFCP
jgi:hypothetical protein